MTIVQTVVLTILTIVIEDSDFTATNNGIFGWLNPDNFLIILIGYGVVCGFFGTLGFTFVVKYFNIVSVINLYMLRPVIAQVIGVYMGIDKMPGPFTFIGIFGMIAAVIL